MFGATRGAMVRGDGGCNRCGGDDRCGHLQVDVVTYRSMWSLTGGTWRGWICCVYDAASSFDVEQSMQNLYFELKI